MVKERAKGEHSRSRAVEAKVVGEVIEEEGVEGVEEIEGAEEVMTEWIEKEVK